MEETLTATHREAAARIFIQTIEVATSAISGLGEGKRRKRANIDTDTREGGSWRIGPTGGLQTLPASARTEYSMAKSVTEQVLMNVFLEAATLG